MRKMFIKTGLKQSMNKVELYHLKEERLFERSFLFVLKCIYLFFNIFEIFNGGDF